MITVAAAQFPYSGSHDIGEAIEVIRDSVKRCEHELVDILCCPEAFLGGLADYVTNPHDVGINVKNGDLDRILSPLASESVAVIVGFTEIGPEEKLYNSAAVYCRGEVIGIYRKRHPAINRSVYAPGEELPVFKVKGLKFGIQICNDSNFPELSAKLASSGAEVIFIPSNNALPDAKADVVQLARQVDESLARDNSIYVVRADVTGIANGLTAHGTSKVVNPAGLILAEAVRFETSLIHATIPLGNHGTDVQVNA